MFQLFLLHKKPQPCVFFWRPRNCFCTSQEPVRHLIELLPCRPIASTRHSGAIQGAWHFADMHPTLSVRSPFRCVDWYRDIEIEINMIKYIHVCNMKTEMRIYWKKSRSSAAPIWSKLRHSSDKHQSTTHSLYQPLGGSSQSVVARHQLGWS